MKWRLHPAVGALLVALAGTALYASLGRSDAGLGTIETLERWSVDLRFRARGRQSPHPDVAVIAFDDVTAEKAGPLFERRAGWARVIRAAKQSGARVIGIDAIFDTPERLLSAEVRDRVLAWAALHPPDTNPTPESQLLLDVAQELQGDAELALAIKEAGNVVLILLPGKAREGARLDPSFSRARYVQSTLGDPQPPEAANILGSLPEFNSAAKALGFAMVDEDETRTVRRIGMARRLEGAVYFPFTIPLVAAYWNVNRSRMAYAGPQHAVLMPDRTLSLDHDSIWLNYRGPGGTYPKHSALDVVEGRLPAGALNGKIVLIGITRFGYDVTRTPFGSMSGVEVQATAVDNVLSASPLRRSTHLFDVLAMLGLGTLCALLFAFKALNLQIQLLGVILVVAGWLTWVWLSFLKESDWLPVVGPLAIVLATAAAGFVLAYAAEALQRRELRKAFGHYLGEEALGELLANPGRLTLGGERRRLTVLFSDIRDFTSLSEKLAPEKLVTLLNTYLSPMTRAVLRQGGLLDKYIGDAVMAVFGAPLVREDHPRQALACALAMHSELADLNAGALRELGFELSIGVGLNTGDMVVGNMGSEERFDYTVAGDAVNLASRLEGLTKKYSAFCLVGDSTRREAGDGFQFRELDLVQVKGKHEAVAIHELLEGPGRCVARYESLDTWASAVADFRAGKLSSASAAFRSFAAMNPKDRAAGLYLERLAALPDVAPEGFSPVTVFETK